MHETWLSSNISKWIIINWRTAIVQSISKIVLVCLSRLPAQLIGVECTSHCWVSSFLEAMMGVPWAYGRVYWLFKSSSIHQPSEVAAISDVFLLTWTDYYNEENSWYTKNDFNLAFTNSCVTHGQNKNVTSSGIFRFINERRRFLLEAVCFWRIIQLLIHY